MRVIVGLGNPGSEYENTRHNAGFVFVDTLASNSNIISVGESLNFQREDKFDALIASAMFKGEKIILVKPQTYMNLSGKSVSNIISFYKADPKDLIIVSDDIDLPLGTVRIRKEGSSGGQKGLQNIIDSLSSDQFLRIRLGIRHSVNGESDQFPDKIDTTNYVLGRFSVQEKNVLLKSIDLAIDFILPFIEKGEEILGHSISLS